MDSIVLIYHKNYFLFFYFFITCQKFFIACQKFFTVYQKFFIDYQKFSYFLLIIKNLAIFYGL